jgi:hypothetical protein
VYPEPMTQVKGKTIRLQADFTIHNFGADSTEFYCGVRVCMLAGLGVS